MAHKESRHKQRYGLRTVRVTGMTYHHLCIMAEQSGLKSPGMVVDKLLRTMRTEAKHADPRH